MAKAYDRARVLTSTTGTGTATLGAALSAAWFTFAEAGVQNADVVTYLIEDGLDFELGRGTYTASGTMLSRDTVLRSKIGGTAGTSKINLSGSAVVSLVVSHSDLLAAGEWRSNAAGRVLISDKVWADADYVGLTDGATITPDLSTGINFSVTLGGNRTLANPTNTKNGQSGVIVITQDGTGSRTLSYGANWEFAGGTAPTLTTGAGLKDVLFYYVISATSIFAALVADVK